MRRFSQRLELTGLADEVVKIYSDSMIDLAYAKDLKYHGRTKNINICFYYI